MLDRTASFVATASDFVSAYRTQLVIAGTAPLVLVVWLWFRNPVICAIVLIPYLAILCFVAQWPRPEWLAIAIPSGIVKRLGGTTADTTRVVSPVTLGALSRLVPNLRQRMLAETRMLDTVEVCSEIRAAMFKAVIFYLFMAVGMMVVIQLEQIESAKRSGPSESVDRKGDEQPKLATPQTVSKPGDPKTLLYLALLFGYVAWHGSECYIHYRRNHHINNGEHEEVSDDHPAQTGQWSDSLRRHAE